MVEVRKRKQENIGSLLRRFSERVRKSGILDTARESQFFTRAKSRRQKRTEAIERVKYRTRMERLRRTGEA